jgi:hypothetical protein
MPSIVAIRPSGSSNRTIDGCPVEATFHVVATVFTTGCRTAHDVGTDLLTDERIAHAVASVRTTRVRTAHDVATVLST